MGPILRRVTRRGVSDAHEAAHKHPPRRVLSCDRYDAVREAEDHCLRMSRLLQMSEAELRCLLAGDATSVAPWIETAARSGFVEAQLRLGQMLLDGHGVRQDEVAALAWFMRAAGKGAAEAMNMVGRCHENGWGARVDLTVASHWYRLSARAGHDWGQYNYANMLFDGRGVVCDRIEAILWYRRAAEQGHARAMNLLARCYEEGWGTPRDRHQACEWYRRSAEGGYFRAQYNFATLLAIQGEIEAALVWFDRALRGATPDSLATMTETLARQDNPRLASFGRRMADELAATSDVDRELSAQ
jgi:TPR repeat protein